MTDDIKWIAISPPPDETDETIRRLEQYCEGDIQISDYMRFMGRCHRADYKPPGDDPTDRTTRYHGREILGVYIDEPRLDARILATLLSKERVAHDLIYGAHDEAESYGTTVGSHGSSTVGSGPGQGAGWGGESPGVREVAIWPPSLDAYGLRSSAFAKGLREVGKALGRGREPITPKGWPYPQRYRKD